MKNKYDLDLSDKLLLKIKKAADLKGMEINEFITWALTEGISKAYLWHADNPS